MHLNCSVPSSSAYPHRWRAKFGSEFLVLRFTEVIHFWSSSAKTQEKPFTNLFKVRAVITFLQQGTVLTWDVERKAQKQLWHFSRLALDRLAHIGGDRDASVWTGRVRGGRWCASQHLGALQRKCRRVWRPCYLGICTSLCAFQG